MGAVSLIAERFFPVSERSTATAIMAEANSFGLAAAFLVGPNMITSSDNVHQLLSFYILCVTLVGINLVAALVYFPSHPPSPPTKSARAQQEAESKMTLRRFMAALWQLFKNPQFWVLSVSYGLTTGIYGAWGSVLSTNLAAINPRYTQSIAGWMGFSATACVSVPLT